MKLNDLYKAILAFCGLAVDDEGCITVAMASKRTPATIGGIPLVLPTEEHLRTSNPKEKIVFHPLSESTLGPISKVVEYMRDTINMRLNYAYGIIGQSLLSLAASPGLHNNLSPDQTEMIIALGDVDDKCLTNFIALMTTSFKADPERAFVNVYLKRGGSRRGVRYSRVGVTTFPGLDLLGKPDSEILSKLKLRAKDYEVFKAMFNYIIPNSQVAEEYNAGCDGVAPSVEALMRTAATVASRFNDIIDLFKDHIDSADNVVFNSDWVEPFNDLASYQAEIRRIPPQGTAPAVVQPVLPPPVITQLAAPAPLAAPAYQPPAPVQAPQQWMAPAQPYQQQQYLPPGYVQPAQQATPGPRLIDGKLDFRSLPGVNNLPNPLGFNQGMYPQQQMQQRQPSWYSNPKPYGNMQGGMPQNYQQPMQQNFSNGFSNNGMV